MIFVTVGTNEAPFDRLLRAVAGFHVTEELVVQRGPSSVWLANASTVDFLPFEELVEHVRRARVVITHAGVGSVLVALGAGKRPVVVPRLKRFREAVDDHQLEFARRFASAGLVTLVESPDDLGDAIAREPGDGRATLSGSSALAGEIRSYVESRLAVSARRR
jgi:UDP-N-acetylglucosamine transferase subunit ALG13